MARRGRPEPRTVRQYSMFVEVPDGLVIEEVLEKARELGEAHPAVRFTIQADDDWDLYEMLDTVKTDLESMGIGPLDIRKEWVRDAPSWNADA